MYKQKSGKVRLPEGKKVAVGIGWDFDAQSIWDGSFNMTSPAYEARGEFGAEVGGVRALKLMDKYNIKCTFFVPGHTADTFPEIIKDCIATGHEIGHHGYVHENPTKATYEQEVKVIEMGLEALDRVGAPRPVTYRSPYWDFSPNTLKIIEKYGFKYDSSLMANDLHPYYPRPVEVHSDSANIFGEPSKILELPCSWWLDDWPPNIYVTGFQEGQSAEETTFKRWKAIYDYALHNEEGACYMLTMHPQCSGSAHLIQMVEKLFAYMQENGAWFATAKEIGEAFVPDEK